MTFFPTTSNTRDGFEISWEELDLNKGMKREWIFIPSKDWINFDPVLGLELGENPTSLTTVHNLENFKTSSSR